MPKRKGIVLFNKFDEQFICQSLSFLIATKLWQHFKKFMQISLAF
jgi:hypothetical protein